MHSAVIVLAMNSLGESRCHEILLAIIGVFHKLDVPIDLHLGLSLGAGSQFVLLDTGMVSEHLGLFYVKYANDFYILF